MTTNTLPVMTDKQLYKKAQFYGKNALLWRQKFIGLLPEVQRRRLYEKKGFGSIFEFAFKLAGLSADQVRLALNLEKRFEDKPVLKKMFENGEVSINKLTRIVSIATSTNETALAEKVKVLPKSALDTLVRDVKAEKKNGLPKPLFDDKCLPGQDLEQKSTHANTLHLHEEVTKKLLDLQKKGLDANKILLELLDRREQEIAQEKEAISAELPVAQSRYIPMKIQRIVHEEHGSKCSIPTCNKPAEHLHHTQIFALNRQHDPRYLAPLCKEHHLIAQSINLMVREKRAVALETKW